MTGAAELLVSIAFKSALILGAAAAACFAMKRASAATRHLILLASLGGLLLLPVAVGLGPGWSPEVPPEVAAAPALARTVLDVAVDRASPTFSLSGLAVWLWGLGCAAMLARTFVGGLRVRRLVGRSRPGEVLGFNVRVSGETSVPAVCGLRRPCVVLPAAALKWPGERLRMVLLHERMHILRHDTRTYLPARLALALYWFNPLAWWAVGRLRREAERACDDGVLMQGEAPADYAGELIGIVQGLQAADRLPEGGLAMGRASELESRLEALLKAGLSRRKATPVLAAGIGLLSLLVLLPLAALRAPAQQTGGMFGVVRDTSGAAVPKARVTVALQGSERREVAWAGDDGVFTIQPLPQGAYTVTVAKPGFALLRLEGIVVAAGKSAEVQPVLNVGQVSESMEVRAERTTPPPPPPPTVAAPQRVTTGGGVQATKLVHMVRPAYPPECRAENIQGTVLLRGVIGVGGGVLDLQQINHLVDQRLADAAMEAVRQWRYEPTLLNGKPVEVITEIQINFALPN
ncbi:MAG: TonB family protein [Bryobacterales bacterium]|nr:TonB family protein [Bryobacterales bacterium]